MSWRPRTSTWKKVLKCLCKVFKASQKDVGKNVPHFLAEMFVESLGQIILKERKKANKPTKIHSQ